MQLTAIIILALVNLALLVRHWPGVRGSTLVGPWVWCMIAIAAVAAAEVVIYLNGNDSWAQPLRYAAAMGTFCPAKAVLGAKRPQNRGWMWVVITLWLVLATPAIQAALFHSDGDVNPFVAWKILIAILLVLEAINWAFSRHRISVFLVILAQLMLLWPHMIHTIAAADFAIGAQVLIAIVLLSALEPNARQRAVSDPIQSVWQRFTSAYGTFWTFRVMSLLNQAAETSGWRVRAMPHGLVVVDSPQDIDDLSELNDEERRALVQTLRNTLRRFVSREELVELESANGE